MDAAGLDEALLGAGGKGNPEEDGQRITQLLKFGAHMLREQPDTAAKADQFATENIDEVSLPTGAGLRGGWGQAWVVLTFASCTELEAYCKSFFCA